MKSLLLIAIVTFLTADCRPDITDVPDWHVSDGTELFSGPVVLDFHDEASDFTDGSEFKNSENPWNNVDGPEDSDSSEVNQQLRQEVKHLDATQGQETYLEEGEEGEQEIVELRGKKKCKTSGMESKINNLTMELQSMKGNHQTVMKTLGDANSKLDHMIQHSDCPEGFFFAPGSHQCFKLYIDSEISWSAARNKCLSNGLELAKPYDAVALRHYIMERYGLNDEIWVGGYGDGSKIVWQRDGKQLRSGNPLWMSGHPSSYSTTYCLSLETIASTWKSYPKQPYSTQPCSHPEFTLCELIDEATNCPEGFFMAGSSNQCFKLLTDSEISWSSARSKCQSEGLALAKPYDGVALRSYIMERYGLADEIWIDGQGDGSKIIWKRDGKQLSSSSPLWRSGNPGSYVSTSYCLALDTLDSSLKSYPGQPYRMQSCSIPEYPLCELIM